MIDTETGVHELSRNRKILVTAGIMSALLLAALDQTIVGTALPRIIADLNGLDRYAWVTTGYLVTSTVMTPISGKLGDLFGRKPFLLGGMIGFLVASWLCGLSQDMTQLVIFRSLQGVAGGVLFASVFTVLADVFPPAQRAKMQGLFGGVFGLASIIGPTLGGFLTDNWGWRWVFYVNVPVGVVAIALIAAFLPFVRTEAKLRDIDFWGAGSLAAGIVPILIALSNTSSWAGGLASWQFISLVAVGFAFLVTFVLVEMRVEHPIVPMELFRNRVFTVSVIVSFVTAFGMFGTIIFVPLIFQGVLGISATNSGTLITPMMIGLIGSSIATGQIMTRIKYYRYLGTFGTAVMMVGIYMLSLVNKSSTEWQVVASLFIVGAGLGITFPLYINAVQSAVSRTYLGVVTSNMQFFRNLGGTIATAILGSILANRLPINISDRVSALHLPAAIIGSFAIGGNPRQIFDPAKLSALRATALQQGGAAGVALFDKVIGAVREGLALTLHEMFLIGLAAIALALVATVFMKEVPLTRTSGGVGEPSPVPESEEEYDEAHPAAVAS